MDVCVLVSVCDLINDMLLCVSWCDCVYVCCFIAAVLVQPQRAAAVRCLAPSVFVWVLGFFSHCGQSSICAVFQFFCTLFFLGSLCLLGEPLFCSFSEGTFKERGVLHCSVDSCFALSRVVFQSRWGLRQVSARLQHGLHGHFVCTV